MLKRHSTTTLEYYERAHDTEHVFELPFDPKTEPETVHISDNGLRAIIGFLPVDTDPLDPFEEYDEGEFYQFNNRHKHDMPRPDIADFKRIVRANLGRVFTIDAVGDGYRVADGPFTAADTRGDGSAVETALDDANGYYICPADATDPAEYAAGSIATYSDYCKGDVYGVVVWKFTRTI